MNWTSLRLLYVHEMRMVLRSRRTIVTSLVLPAILMPILILASSYLQQQESTQLDQTTFRYAVTGPWAGQARELVERYSDSPEFRNLHLERLTVDDPDLALQQGHLDFYLRTMSVEEADQVSAPLEISIASAGGVQAGSTPVTGVPALQVVYRGNQDLARRGAERVIDMLRAARRAESYSVMLTRGFPSHPEGFLAMTSVSVATESQVSGANLGRFFTLILVVWLVAAGSVAAMDIIAGEKERGTLETLITTAAGRTEIATAKHLAIFTVGLSITFMQIVYALIYIRLNIIELPESFAIDLSFRSVAELMILFVPLAAAIAAGLLIVSAHARTYKEAQVYFFPLYLGSLVPALAAVLPGLRSRSLVALIPVANVSVAAREVLTGRPDSLMILTTVCVMSLIALALIRYSARLLDREEVVISGQHEQPGLEGGEDLFPRRVFTWFAVLWAVTFVASTNFPQLQTIQSQLLFNEIGIFLAGSLLMVRQYRMDLREVIGIRRLRWPVWVAVLMAVPAAQIVARAFFRVVSTVIPSPGEPVREVNQQLAPPGLPIWEMYIVMAILPAICEEFAFRGVLLHGLRNRYHPVVRCLIVGLIFGVFHYNLFRIAPTALLGVVLTAIALMTGSILPSLLFHAANNSYAIWLETTGLSPNRLDWGTYVAAFAVFILAMHTIWRYGKES